MMRDRLLGRLPVGARGVAVLRTGAYALLTKACAVGNLFVSMPLVHDALNPSGFGAWVTLASIATLGAFLDFGLANGAMNLVAAAHAREDRREVYSLVLGAWRILTRTAVLLSLVALVLLACLPWSDLLGLDKDMGPQARAAAAATLLAMVAGVPLGLALRMQLAIGSAKSGYRLGAAGHVLACITTILLAHHGASLPVLVAATLWPPALASMANTLRFARRLRDSTPIGAGTNQTRVVAIQREGLLFFVLQLAAALAYASDLPLISALASADEAGRYAVVQRLFSLGPLALGLLWTPLWPVYRQAFARQEYAWAFRTLRRSVAGAILASAGVAALCWHWFDAISGAWMRVSVSPRPELLAGMAAWAVADAAGGAYGTFLNAAGMFRFLVVTAILLSAATLAAKFWLVAHGHIALLPWATLTCFLLIDMIPLTILWPRMKRNLQARVY